jgi:hypothetical protein
MEDETLEVQEGEGHNDSFSHDSVLELGKKKTIWSIILTYFGV